MSYNIRLEGFDTLADDAASVSSSFRGYVRSAMNKSTILIKNDARRIRTGSFRNRTGNLRRSITRKVSNNGFHGEISVGSQAPYGIYVEEGTKPHIIRPKNKKMLAFKVGGRMVFAKQVRHPGTKAYKFMEYAFKNNLDEVQRLFSKEILEKVLNKLTRKFLNSI